MFSSRFASYSAALTRSTPKAADRKSTRLNSSHSQISYAAFCLTKNDATPARATLATAQGLLLLSKNQLDRGPIDVTRALGLDPATPLALTASLSPSLGAADGHP